MPKLSALPSLLHAANTISREEPDNLDAIKVRFEPRLSHTINAVRLR